MQKNVQKTCRYYPFTHVYHKWRSYDVWFLKYKARQTKFFVILSHFLPFAPPNNLKKQNFKKNEKKKNNWRYYHFTIVYHKWKSYDVWFTRHELQQTLFLSFWATFCPFPPLTTWKIRIFVKLKITLGEKCTKNHDHMLYCSWDMACHRW